MNGNKYVQEELLEIAPAIDSSMATPFTVPPLYFKNLSESILEDINSLKINSLQTPFTFPTNYFETLSSVVLTEIKSFNLKGNSKDELELIAPVLNSMDKVNMYSVPMDYFAQLSFNTKQTSFAIVVDMKYWKNYAIAAAVSALLIISAFLFSDRRYNSDYSANYKIDSTKVIQTIPDIELQKYVYACHPSNLDIINLTEIVAPNVQESLRIASDEELQQYISQTDIVGNKRGS